jgi:hypothetical protein
MFDLLLLGTWPLWIFFLFVVFVAECVAIEYESAMSAGVLLLIAVIGLPFIGGVNPFTWVLANPILFGLYFLWYVLIGAGYSVFRFWLYLRDLRSHLRELKAQNLMMVEVPKFNDKMIYLIQLWMVYWPVSMFWTLSNRPIKWLYNTLYDLFRSTYVKIYKSVFKEFL